MLHTVVRTLCLCYSVLQKRQTKASATPVTMIMVRPTNSRHLLLLPLLVFLWLQSLDSSNALLPSQTVARKRHVVHLTFPITSTSVKSFKNGSDQEADPTAMQASITEIDSDEPEVLPNFLLKRNPPPIMSNTELMAAMGTSPRRILLSLASTTGIALAANFLGVTSHLLEVIPESAVEASGLDTYFPRGKLPWNEETCRGFANINLFIGNYKRYKGQGYTFVMPKEWVADTGLELAKAQRRAKMLDYEIKQSSGNAVLPDAGKLLTFLPLDDDRRNHAYRNLSSPSLWSARST